jgi:hypothetical protein
MEYVQRRGELAEGTFEIIVQDVLANDEHGLVRGVLDSLARGRLWRLASRRRRDLQLERLERCADQRRRSFGASDTTDEVMRCLPRRRARPHRDHGGDR